MAPEPTTGTPTPTPTPLLDLPGLGRYLGVAPTTLRNWRSAGTAPPALKLGGAVRWRVADVDAWLAARREATRTVPAEGVDR